MTNDTTDTTETTETTETGKGKAVVARKKAHKVFAPATLKALNEAGTAEKTGLAMAAIDANRVKMSRDVFAQELRKVCLIRAATGVLSKALAAAGVEGATVTSVSAAVERQMKVERKHALAAYHARIKKAKEKALLAAAAPKTPEETPKTPLEAAQLAYDRACYDLGNLESAVAAAKKAQEAALEALEAEKAKAGVRTEAAKVLKIAGEAKPLADDDADNDIKARLVANRAAKALRDAARLEETAQAVNG